jgi:hypothetical protein
MAASIPAMNASPDDRPEGLLAWQWERYPPSHRNRTNLLVHALTAPVFIAGTLALINSPFLNSPFLSSFSLGLGGLAAMLGVVAIQRRTHRLENSPPSSFRGPLDVVQRFFVEQWINFPRYVLTGEFARAWRGEPVTPARP